MGSPTDVDHSGSQRITDVVRDVRVCEKSAASKMDKGVFVHREK